MLQPAPPRRRTLAAIAAAIALVALIVGAPPLGWAQSDHSTVLRVLRESRDFRARVRAALALGASSDPAVAPHLATALSSDAHAAVRAAAASGLGRVGGPESVGPLRRALADREESVRREAQRALDQIASRAPPPPTTVAPTLTSGQGGRYPVIAVVPQARDISWSTVRYVVVMGPMQNRSTFSDDTLQRQFGEEVTRHLVVLRGVAVLREGQVPVDAEREIRRRGLPKLRLEGSLTRVDRRAEPGELSVRCEVSLMLMDDPGRNLRSVLNGAATGSGPRVGAQQIQERRLAQQALTGAVRSAMSGAARAIASAGH